jgi:hypothetical protein
MPLNNLSSLPTFAALAQIVQKRPFVETPMNVSCAFQKRSFSVQSQQSQQSQLAGKKDRMSGDASKQRDLRGNSVPIYIFYA